MDERLKTLRKKLGLTQQEFADRLNIKRGAVANYEIGRNIPIDAVVSLICKEFNVNRDWLVSGEGGDDAIFIQSPQSVFDKFAQELHLGPRDRILIEKFLALPDVGRQAVMDYALSVAAAVQEERAPTRLDSAPAKAPQEMTDAELHAELDRQLKEEKRRTANGSAFGSGNSGRATG